MHRDQGLKKLQVVPIATKFYIQNEVEREMGFGVGDSLNAIKLKKVSLL